MTIPKSGVAERRTIDKLSKFPSGVQDFGRRMMIEVTNRTYVLHLIYREDKKVSHICYAQTAPLRLCRQCKSGIRPTPVSLISQEDPSMHAVNASKCKEINGWKRIVI